MRLKRDSVDVWWYVLGGDRVWPILRLWKSPHLCARNACYGSSGSASPARGELKRSAERQTRPSGTRDRSLCSLETLRGRLMISARDSTPPFVDRMRWFWAVLAISLIGIAATGVGVFMKLSSVKTELGLRESLVPGDRRSDALNPQTSTQKSDRM